MFEKESERKLVLTARPEDRERARAFFAQGAAGSRLDEAAREDYLTSAMEVFDAFCAADPNGGQMILRTVAGASGMGAHYMHQGPIFNPCSNDGKTCPYTHEHMDETSYEFKYGRNAQYVFKRCE